MDKSRLVNSDLPLVPEYNNRYESTDLTEVVKLAKQNDPTALYELARRYHKGEKGVEKDLTKAVKLYRKVLEYEKNVYAMYHVGYLLMDGVMGEENEAKGISYYEAACELGDPDAAVQLGILHQYGYIVEQNYDTAMELFDLAIERGQKNAYFNKGEIYEEKGMNVEAVQCYKAALDNNNFAALIPLGLCYENGKGVEKDVNRAVEYYKRAYQNKEEGSLYHLGRVYYYGIGVEEDEVRAYKLLKKASELGYNGANYHLGIMYASGIEGFLEKDVDTALRYLSNVPAVLETDALSLKGNICLKENRREEAEKWLTLAAQAGHEKARELLDYLHSEEGGADDMIQRVNDMMSRIGEDGSNLTDAAKLIAEAEKKYPNNLRIKERFARIYDIIGHINLQIGMPKEAMGEFQKVLKRIEILKQHNFELKEMEELEDSIYVEYGDAAYRLENIELALDLFSKTNYEKHPYVAVLTTMAHFSSSEKYAHLFYDDACKLKNVLNSDKWESKFDKASAYLALSLLYVYGQPGYFAADVKYAYECIQRCAELEPNLAENELKKYSKGLFGKITYKSN